MSYILSKLELMHNELWSLSNKISVIVDYPHYCTPRSHGKFSLFFNFFPHFNTLSSTTNDLFPFPPDICCTRANRATSSGNTKSDGIAKLPYRDSGLWRASPGGSFFRFVLSFFALIPRYHIRKYHIVTYPILLSDVSRIPCLPLSLK
jgi:hypothetical protein